MFPNNSNAKILNLSTEDLQESDRAKKLGLLCLSATFAKRFTNGGRQNPFSIRDPLLIDNLIELVLNIQFNFQKNEQAQTLNIENHFILERR